MNRSFISIVIFLLVVSCSKQSNPDLQKESYVKLVETPSASPEEIALLALKYVESRDAHNLSLLLSKDASLEFNYSPGEGRNRFGRQKLPDSKYSSSDLVELLKHAYGSKYVNETKIILRKQSENVYQLIATYREEPGLLNATEIHLKKVDGRWLLHLLIITDSSTRAK